MTKTNTKEKNIWFLQGKKRFLTNIMVANYYTTYINNLHDANIPLSKHSLQANGLSVFLKKN